MTSRKSELYMSIPNKLRAASTRFIQKLKSESLEGVLFYAPVMVLASAAIGLFDVILQRVVQGGSDKTNVIIGIISIGIVFAGLLWVSRWIAERYELPSFLGTMGRRRSPLAKSFILSSYVALFLLCLVTHLAVWKDYNHFLEWYRYGFLDKRWIFALYWTAVLSLLVLPPLIYKVLISENLFQKASFSEKRVAADSLEKMRKSWRARVLEVSLALVFSALLFGPPWNIERTPIYVDFHEQVHLGPLQAIHEGYLPNIGPASQQYGPGTQLLTYAYMKWTDRFDLIGFRNAHGTFFFVGFSFLAVVAFSYLGISWGLATLLVALSVSPFHLTYWNEFGGFNVWGWPNPLRYLGVLLLVVALASILMERETRKKLHPMVIAVGWLWGMFIWISPENLMMGATASGIFGALMWATESVSIRRLVLVGLNVTLGAFVFWLPILVFYRWHDCLGEYLFNMFLVGQQVLAGLSNIPTSGSILNVARHKMLFYGLIPFVIVVGWSALYKSCQLRRPLARSQVLLLALVSVSVTNFLGTLTRTDVYHLLNVLIALPMLLVYTIKVVPSFISEKGARRGVARAALVGFTFLVAFYGYDTSWYVSRIRNPLKKHSDFEQAIAVPPGLAGRSFARTGYQVLPPEQALEPAVTPREEKDLHGMGGYFELFDEMGERFEGKNVYVRSLPEVAPGLAYFLADISPPPILFDPYTMVFSSDIQAYFLKHFETIVDRVHCVVSEPQDYPSPEARLLIEAVPNASIEQGVFADVPIRIVCR